MSARKLLNEMHEHLLKCSICLEQFPLDDQSQSPKAPRQLPCLHTFCKQCLSDWIHRSIDEPSFSCPMCRNSYDVPSDGADHWPASHFMKTMMGIMKEFQVSKALGKCSICLKKKVHNKGNWYCFDCRGHFCDTCKPGHDLYQDRHTIESVLDLNDPDISLMLGRVKWLCTEHEGKNLKMFCEQCQQLACSACAISHHIKCTKIEYLQQCLPIYTKKLKEHVETCSGRIKVYDDYLLKVSQNTNDVQEEFARLREELAQQHHRITKSLDDRREALIKVLDDRENKMVEELNTAWQSAASRIESISKHVKYSNAILERGIGAEIVQAFVQKQLDLCDDEKFAEQQGGLIRRADISWELKHDLTIGEIKDGNVSDKKVGEVDLLPPSPDPGSVTTGNN